MRNLRDTRTRAEKLRDLAEHPASNPHEAASAREELARMKAAGTDDTSPRSWRDVANAPDMDTFGRWYAEMARRDRSRPRRCWICGMLIPPLPGFISPTNCPVHLDVKGPGDEGYYEWARSLRVGDRVSVHDGKFPTEIRIRPTVTIERMTKTQYVMSNGGRYRRTGVFPGYCVGEDGRDGRRSWIYSDTVGG